MTDFGRRGGVGDMLKATYDPNLDGVIAVAQTEADMTQAVYDPTINALVALAAAHKTQHQNGGTDEISATGLVGRVNYVDRGDPSGNDKWLGDLTTNGLWHDLDLSNFAAVGAKVLHLTLFVDDDAANSFVQIREKGNTNAKNILELRTAAAAVRATMDGFVTVAADRIIEYRTTDTTLSAFGLSVRGWFI